MCGSLSGNGGTFSVANDFAVGSVSGFSVVDIQSCTMSVGTALQLPQDGTLNFDVTGRRPNAYVMLDVAPQFDGAANLTVTVSAAQEYGTYALMGGASGFDQSISVLGVDKSLLCTLSVGQVAQANGVAYELARTDATLSLTISEGVATPEELARREFEGDIGFDKNYQDEFALDVALPGWFTLSGNFGELNGSVDIVSGKKKVASGTIKKGVLTFNKGKPALLAAGDYTVVVKNSDKGKSASAYSFALEGQKIFTKGDNSDDWEDVKTKGADGAVGDAGALTAKLDVQAKAKSQEDRKHSRGYYKMRDMETVVRKETKRVLGSISWEKWKKWFDCVSTD